MRKKNQILNSQNVKGNKTMRKCMYCGTPVEFGGNPADFIHYTDEDIFGRKFVCEFCDGVITQMNRYFSFAVEERKTGNIDGVINQLEAAKLHLERRIAYIKDQVQ